MLIQMNAEKEVPGCGAFFFASAEVVRKVWRRTKEMRRVVAAVFVAWASVAVSCAQDVPANPAQAPVMAQSGRTPEVPVEGLVRKDAYTVGFTLPSKQELVLSDFEFEGERVQSNKLHFRQLSPGVVEITSVAYTVGYWRFRVRDTANYYGLGERFNALNHSHTIIRNSSADN